MSKQTDGFIKKVKTMMRRLCCHDCIDNPFASLTSWQRRKSSHKSSDDDIALRVSNNDDNKNSRDNGDNNDNGNNKKTLLVSTVLHCNAFELPETKVNILNIMVDNPVITEETRIQPVLETRDSIKEEPSIQGVEMEQSVQVEQSVEIEQSVEVEQSVEMEQSVQVGPSVQTEPSVEVLVTATVPESPMSPSVYLSREEILSHFADPDSDFELDDEWILMLQVLTKKNTS